MSTKEVLKRHNAKLREVLPVENPVFLEVLKKYGILPEDAQCIMQAKETKADKADCYIQYIIKSSKLPKLLEAMEKYYNESTEQNSDLQNLLIHMIAELNRDKKPLMRHIDSHVVKRLSSKWKELGSQLNISENVIKRIDSAYPNDCERCCRIVFHEWLREPARVTWEVLISAVDNVTDNVTDKEPKMLEINLLMNILPFIQKKWQLIGLALRLSSELLDKIYMEAEQEKIPSNSFNTLCCVKVLTHWFFEGDDVSDVTITKAISTPHICLRHEILSNISAIITDKDVSSLSPNYVKPYGEMKANVYKELCSFRFSIDFALQYLQNANVNPGVLKSITNFQDLFNSLEKNELMHMADVCWLMNIVRQAQCESALRYIEEYCNLLIADKILWGDNQMRKTITYLVAKVSSKTLNNCTIKHCADIKIKLNKITGINETDSILSFSEVSSKDCSLTFYWRVTDKRIITIPKVIVMSLKRDCIDLGITHIGTTVNDNLEVVNISELQIEGCKVATSSQPVAEDHNYKLPAKLYTNKDLSELRDHYHSILHLMPDDFEPTIEKLLEYINDDQVCTILSSTSSIIANKRILDCLIERVNCKESLLDLCDQLDNITKSPGTRMKSVTNEMRLGVQQSIQIPINTALTQPSVSSDHQHHSSSSSTYGSLMFQTTFRQIQLDPNSKVLAILKKNYTRLCQCLPQDYMKTINILKELLRPSDDQVRKWMDIAAANVFNETAVGMIMSVIISDAHALYFCDIMEKLYDSKSSKMYIEILRKDFLKAFSLPPIPDITTLITTSQTMDTNIATIDTTVSEQFARPAGAPSASRNPSITDVNSIPQLPQGNATPNLLDLHREIISQYAVRWRALGTQLNISTNSLDIIEANNSHHREHVRTCCRDMLIKWIETDTEATWNKLHKAIAHLPPLSDDKSSKWRTCLKPPPLPSTYVPRQKLLDEIATKLLQTTIDPDNYEATLTITGASGFGKTTTVISLCHHPVVKEHFTDGFVVIELGPQATEPSIKLNQLYHLLTGEYLEHCSVKYAEQEINQLMSNHYRNLLIIIDDVWHVEDAEPLMVAFSNCKTILTTSLNYTELNIPSKQSIIIGPMTQCEAFSLLTNGIMNISTLSQEDVSLLNELAQNVHLWPLLLSLIRGQLSHNLKQYRLSYHKAIQKVQAKLHHKGLTAFDKNSVEAINKSRKLAVKACIEITLDLLTKALSNKIKSLILWTGIGTSLQTAVLSNLWNISKEEAKDTVDLLWRYGLVQYTDITIYPSNITQHCVEVHAVISQYIIESIDSIEVYNLAPHGGKLNTGVAIDEGLSLTFQQSYGIDDLFSLNNVDYLKYKLSEIENSRLPHFLHSINMYIVVDPHPVIKSLETIHRNLVNTTCTESLLKSLRAEFDSLISDCKQFTKEANRLCRKINHNAQIYLYEKDYEKLIQTIEEFIKEYPMCNIAQKAIITVKKMLPHCHDELLQYVMNFCKYFQMKTCNYHHISMLTLPYIKLYIQLHKQITDALQNGSPHIEMTYYHIMFGNFGKDFDLIETNRIIELKEVSSNWLQMKA